jgi:Uma2 family endonuclease
MTMIDKKRRSRLGNGLGQSIPTQRMSVPVVGPMTYKEFLATDFEDPHVEWVNGEVVAMSPINQQHELLTRLLAGVLDAFVRERKLGVIFSEPFQMKLRGKQPGRSPDIFYVSDAHKKRRKESYLDGPADLVVEIISPGSRGRDRGEKFYEYEAGGVPEYWLIDPQRKQADFFLLNRGGRYVPAEFDAAGNFHSRAIAGVWINPSWLWANPLPTPLTIEREWGLV